MNRDARFALSQELEAKQTLLDQLRAMAADDPDFLNAVAPEDIPARWWKPQPPKLDQDGLTKAIRAREKALKEAEAIGRRAENPCSAGHSRPGQSWRWRHALR